MKAKFMRSKCIKINEKVINNDEIVMGILYKSGKGNHWFVVLSHHGPLFRLFGNFMISILHTFLLLTITLCGENNNENKR